jgi:hypothetical protein
VHLTLPSTPAPGDYTLATYSGGSGAFNSTPVIDSGSLGGNTGTIVTSGGTVTLHVAASTLATTVALVSSSQTNGYLGSVNFTATVQTNGVAATDATGWMVFATNFVAMETNALVAGASTSSGLSNLPRGTNLIIAIYSGDVNHLASTNTLNQVVTNHPPVANTNSYSRNSLNDWKISVANLLTNATDADGDTLTLVDVGTSTNGITLVTTGGFVHYTNTSLVDDQFNYTVTDGYGGTNTGVITLLVGASSPGTNTITSIVYGNPTTLTAFGVPSYIYVTERATNINQVVWDAIATNIGPSITVTDSNPPSPSAFYRIRWQPQP